MKTIELGITLFSRHRISSVEIVLTFEGMGIVMCTLYLDGGMIQFVLAAAEIGHGIQGLKRLG